MRASRFSPLRFAWPDTSDSRRWRLLAALPLLALLAAWQSTSWSQDAYPPGAPLDPPGQVARLDLAQGPLSYAPADAAGPAGPGNGNAWTPADLNRPLTRGDRLWTGSQARAELHAGSTAVRMGEETSLDFLALDDSVVQLRLPAGSVQLRVRALFEGQRLEIDTPNLAFVISQPGDYRLDVNPAADTTRVVARAGSGVIYGDGVSLALGSAQQVSFSGARLAPAATGAALRDGFDAWTAERDRREDESVSARYIPRETIGYQQLDSYGDWQQDPAYGAVWLPRAVPLDWAPYRAGRWSWISPWGWTWVDDAPWGFAPFHYGRWTQIGPRWAWVPGQLPPRPVYAPALVAFVGGGNWNLALGAGSAPRPALGWFPLAPGEAFRPAYRASPRYVSRVNNNTVNNTVNVTNIYRYQHQPAAVTAASRDDFAHGRWTPGNVPALSAADLSRAQVLANQSAMPQRQERPEPRERPRLAPAAVPPPAVAAQAVVRSQGEHGNDRRAFPNRADERPNDPRAGRFESSDRTPRLLTPTPVAPAAAGAVAVQPPAVRPLPVPAPERSAPEAEQRVRREQQRQPSELIHPQDQQRLQGEAALGQQRAMREQAQRQQELVRQQAQQRQQAELARQQDQQRRQGEAAVLQQQRAMQEQAHRQQETLRQQQQQQQQAHEQQRRQGEAALLQQQRALHQQARQQAQQQRAAVPEPPRLQAQGGQPPRAPEAAQRRGQPPEGVPHGHREP